MRQTENSYWQAICSMKQRFFKTGMPNKNQFEKPAIRPGAKAIVGLGCHLFGICQWQLSMYVMGIHEGNGSF
jgi:hypothetical protein